MIRLALLVTVCAPLCLLGPWGVALATLGLLALAAAGVRT